MLVYAGCSEVWDPAVDLSMINPSSEGATDACHEDIEEKSAGDDGHRVQCMIIS